MARHFRLPSGRKTDVLIARLRRRAAALSAELAAERRERHALQVVSAAVSQTLDLKQVLNEAFARMLEVADLGAGMISLVDPATGGTRLVAWRGIPEPMLEELHARRPGQGLAAEVLRTGAPLVSDDLRREPNLYARQAIVAGFRSYLCVPLQANGEIAGIVSVLSPAVGRFHEREVHLLCAVGEQIGIAIARAQLYQRERRRAEQLRVINEVSRRIVSILDVDTLLPFVTSQLVETFGYDNANIFLLDAAQESMVLRAGHGLFTAPPPIGAARLRVGEEGIVGWVARSGQPLLVPDVQQEPRYMEMDELRGIRSELAVPVRAGGTVVGVVDIESRALGAFDEGDVSTVQILADQIAVALENARLYQESRILAATEERNRLASEIHDVLAQGLTGIALQIELAETVLDSDPSLARRSLQKALALVRGNLDEARHSVLDLRSSPLHRQTLTGALQEMASSFERETGIVTRLGVEGVLQQLSARLERGLHRIVQEALASVVRPSGATAVDVKVCQVGEDVQLVIEDNGAGFDPGEGCCLARLPAGLVGIQERAKLLGGRVKLHSDLGCGLRIDICVPLAHHSGRAARRYGQGHLS